MLGAVALVATLTACDLAAISRVSGDMAGTTAGPYHDGGDVSDDGSIVVFTSNWAYDTGDTNGVEDVILSDRNTGFIGRASYAADGGAPSHKATEATVSGDGRYISWTSRADNMVAGDTNNVEDVFRYDLETGTTERVSVSSAGQQGNAWSSYSSMSDDGRFVAFQAAANDLVPDDDNYGTDVFVRDTVAGTTRRWSVDVNGEEAYTVSSEPQISGDGMWVVFTMGGAFDSSDTNDVDDVYRKHRDGPIVRVSSPGGSKGSNGHSGAPAVNQDGSVVAFQSDATDLDPDDDNGELDIFVWEDGVLELVSRTPDGGVGSRNARRPSVDGSGNLVGFDSSSPELTPDLPVPPGPPQSRAFVRNRLERRTDLVSSSVLGEVGDDDDFLRAVSGDGRSVLVSGRSTNLAPDDPNASGDIFVKAYPFPRITRVTPSVLIKGTTTTVTIEGKGFSGPIHVSLSDNPGAAITTSGTIWVSPTRVRVNVTVPLGAAVHDHDLTLWNLGEYADNTGAETTCSKCLSVTVT